MLRSTVNHKTDYQHGAWDRMIPDYCAAPLLALRLPPDSQGVTAQPSRNRASKLLSEESKTWPTGLPIPTVQCFSSPGLQ